MRTTDVLRAWKKILAGRAPSLSIEITRECPLRCPGCYAYEAGHLGGGVGLRSLADFKGDALVEGILDVVDREKPLHLSLVGGDPLVRYRELEKLLPQLVARGIHVQVVTSAFRPIPAEWASMPHLSVVVSIDGLQPEHDVRRAPATYDRILKNIVGQQVTVHCTITSQMLVSAGYLERFLAFWSQCEWVRKIWFSLFTPQRGATDAEILTPAQRRQVVEELLALRESYAKLDMAASMIRHYLKPPESPSKCIFAQTTRTISADLTTVVTPCQFGGDPDCAQCGCYASAGLAAVGGYKVGGLVPAGAIFHASWALGKKLARRREARRSEAPAAGAVDLITIDGAEPEAETAPVKRWP